VSLKKSDRDIIINDIIRNIPNHANGIVKFISEKYSLSRQTVNRYLDSLIEKNLVLSSGNGRNKKYKLSSVSKSFLIDIRLDNDESTVWLEKIKPIFPPLGDSVYRICNYGFTEILNNAIEHSQGMEAHITVEYTALYISFIVHDNGIGIFKKIQRDLGLDSPNQSILELAKGKMTSAPDKHSGEGIFFTSKAFDKFFISSDKLVFIGNQKHDYFFDNVKMNIEGTRVYMEINFDSNKNLTDIFDTYTSGDNFGFSKTVVPVALLENQGTELVSRSQARRLLNRFEKFEEIILDFTGVDFIGQAFADEIFRVFKNQHPNVKIAPSFTNETVDKMIKHVLQNII
jgi:predicted transcriptional regulator/anti-sigma regulatory factor (Ser/Thr protein kinase)